ncbi:insulin receptor substrate 2-B-like isoform X3 [Festucalex cinctus]
MEMVDWSNRRAVGSEQMCMATKLSSGDCQMSVRGGELGHNVGVQVTPLDSYEEFFCSSQTSIHLLSALVTYTGRCSDVVKQGYLGKLERSHRRYFVLRAGSHTGSSRLEWYKSQEKFAAVEKSSGKATMFGPKKQGVIYLRSCIGVGCLGSSRKGLTVALYAQDQTMVLVADNQQEQEAWYLSIKKMIEEHRDEDQACDDEDDGYCTLPPAAFFKEVWPVSVSLRGLGRLKSLAGELRLCLTATSLILVRVGACSDLASVTIPLLAVRRFGHLEGSFFLELGRSSPIGPGELWFEAKGRAQHIHEVVRDTVRALRALPDFSRSPSSSHNPLLASKRCRPKYREKKNPDVQTGPTRCQQPDTTEPQSPLNLHSVSLPEPDRYMDMSKQPCDGECCEGEGVGYMMMMSPQVSHSSWVLPQDTYVTMSSPQKQNLPASISPQRRVNSQRPATAPFNPQRTTTAV